VGCRTQRSGALTEPAIRFERDDVTRQAVIALAELHLHEAYDNSPPESVFALDLSGLRRPEVTVWTVWEGDALLGMGALKQLDAAHGEVKAMRTAPAHLRRGIAGAVLAHLVEQGCARGYRRLSLETGATEPYAPARTLYERAGFLPCPPFGDYVDVGFSRYYTRALSG